MSSFKILVSIVLFSTGIYKVVVLMSERKLFEAIEQRSPNGFVLDNAPPLAVSAPEAQKILARIEDLKQGRSRPPGQEENSEVSLGPLPEEDLPKPGGSLEEQQEPTQKLAKNDNSKVLTTDTPEKLDPKKK
ncbi:MAG: hypothetical protein AAF202_06735, partial [Pseudomonadota bacterium]